MFDTKTILGTFLQLVDESHVMDVADYTYLTYMNIYFKEDNLWVLVTQHVESWSYSDTGPTPEEAEESVLVIYTSVSRNAQSLINKSISQHVEVASLLV